MSERLEEIKRSARVIKFTLDKNGETRELTGLPDEHHTWLIEQAERIKELEEQLLALGENCIELNKEKEIYRKSLEQIAKAGENQLTGIEMMSIATNALLEGVNQ